MFARVLILAVLVAPIAAAPQPPAQHQHEGGQPPERLGMVDFETSCSTDVKADFNRAVALLHSFWWTASGDAFEAVSKKDPSCAMAHWGMALSQWGNPFGGMRSATTIERGRPHAARAMAMKATDRERAFIAAVAALYSEEHRTQRDRTLAYERAMRDLHEKFREDREAATFYALAINQTALPTDKQYTKQLQAAAILEPLFAAQPDHPGLAHYLIHAYDHPSLAERALPAARRYAGIAPDAPHALHMPSHTFTRVGYWEESVKTNRASADAARRANSPGEILHALDYQIYAYLQMARDREARTALEEARAVDATMKGGGGFAMAAMPARFALERGAWAEAAALQTRTENVSYVEAITRFARALGAARAGNPAAAEPEIARLGELHAALLTAGDEYWAQQVEIQQRSAKAWAAFAAGQHDTALRALREVAALEDSTDKAAVTPGPLAPAREQLGEMLLAMDRPADALREFEAVMKKEPNRFRATYFAARAAEAAGLKDAAEQHYRAIVRIAAAGDSDDRPELREARQKAGR
jgi:hypothetical protein